jgi:hypothetical protein
MAMEINSVYGNYASAYANQKETKQVKDSKSTSEAAKTEGQASSVRNTKQTESTRKTAADELAYLSKKYDGYSFVSANFRPGMQYGSKDTVNVAISPTFLKKMANNPELEAEYEKEIANMKACDERKVHNIEGQGDRVIAKGWAIDKDGNISSWTIGERGHRPKVVSPNEYGAKIRQQKAEKRKEQERIAAKKEAAAEKKEALEEKRKADQEEQAVLKEKIDADNRQLLGNMYKGSEWYDVSDNSFAGEKAKVLVDDAVGMNLDMKL